MTSQHIYSLVEQMENEIHLMKLAMNDKDSDRVDYHANKVISLSGEVRRETFLESYKSGTKG